MSAAIFPLKNRFKTLKTVSSLSHGSPIDIFRSVEEEKEEEEEEEEEEVSLPSYRFVKAVYWTALLAP